MNAVRPSNPRRLILALGSNIAPEQHLPQAICMLEAYGQIEAISSAWETPAYGSVAPNFINAAVAMATPFTVGEFKKLAIHNIETSLGRVRTSDKYAPRTIDIDIIVEDGEIIDAQVWELAHIAMPVSEILPDLPHPRSGKALRQVARRLARQTLIKHRPDVSLK
ncbi:MAG: 2-amino-4-hydroxy-6-hydroxymethyldihydropteridine diphosphokinase [Anaerolineales bacterium]|nr:2-amino-4-hydroxy-6-hydroxymethyldihydropteridine diphosphokinase [Anaerolineales bacterium]